MNGTLGSQKGIAARCRAAGGLIETTLGELREELGYKKLGRYVLGEITEYLGRIKLGYFPADALDPDRNTEPRQWQKLWIYEKSDDLRSQVIDAVLNPGKHDVRAILDRLSDEVLIAESGIVVTISYGGYAKRTNTDQYRAQRRGGKDVRGAQLHSYDIADHFFVTSTHHWILFFTNKGRVYRVKGYDLPDAGRGARGQHVANLLAFQPDETIAEVLALRDYEAAPYLVLATRSGLVQKTRLADYDSMRSGGLIAINLRDDDEVISARLVSPDEDLLLVSKEAKAVRFQASDESLRPMACATSGVLGMRFNEGDELLGMYVVREGEDVLVATERGYAKRTSAEEYPARGRGIGGISAPIVEDRGRLVGALMVRPEDEIFVITTAGSILRTRAGEVKQSGWQKKWVRLMDLAPGDSVVALARNAESVDEAAEGPFEVVI